MKISLYIMPTNKEDLYLECSTLSFNNPMEHIVVSAVEESSDLHFLEIWVVGSDFSSLYGFVALLW